MLWGEAVKQIVSPRGRPNSYVLGVGGKGGPWEGRLFEPFSHINKTTDTNNAIVYIINLANNIKAHPSQ